MYSAIYTIWIVLRNPFSKKLFKNYTFYNQADNGNSAIIYINDM